MSTSFTAPDPAFEPRVRESFARQLYMATLGARLARVAAGEVDIELPVVPALTQQHGSVHAGAVTSVLDSAAGYAALSLMPADAGVVSVEFKVNLLEPARGERIVAEGRVLRAGRTLFTCTAEAWAVDGARRTRVAILQGTMMCLVGRGVSAKAILSGAAKAIGGGAGGKDDLATGGGNRPDGIAEALRLAADAAREALGA